jgi:hypothetical protein
MAVKNGCWLAGGCGVWVLSGTGDVGVLVVEPFATVAWRCVAWRRGLAFGVAARAAVPAITPTAASAASAPVAV